MGGKKKRCVFTVKKRYNKIKECDCVWVKARDSYILVRLAGPRVRTVTMSFVVRRIGLQRRSTIDSLQEMV